MGITIQKIHIKPYLFKQGSETLTFNYLSKNSTLLALYLGINLPNSFPSG